MHTIHLFYSVVSIEIKVVWSTHEHMVLNLYLRTRLLTGFHTVDRLLIKQIWMDNNQWTEIMQYYSYVSVIVPVEVLVFASDNSFCIQEKNWNTVTYVPCSNHLNALTSLKSNTWIHSSLIVWLGAWMKNVREGSTSLWGEILFCNFSPKISGHILLRI